MLTFKIDKFSNPVNYSLQDNSSHHFSLKDLNHLNLQNYVDEFGYLVLENISEEYYLELSNILSSKLGTKFVINNKDYMVINNDNLLSTSFHNAYSNNFQPFHVDMRLNSPRINYISMYCLNNALEGGNTLILNINEFIKNLSNISKKYLENAFVYYTAKNQVKIKLYQNNCINYNPLFQKIEFDNINDYTIFNELFDFINTIKEFTELKLEANNLIIINNKSFLHARTSFESNSKRKMVRTMYQ